jgi:hypothetical protein
LSRHRATETALTLSVAVTEPARMVPRGRAYRSFLVCASTLPSTVRPVSVWKALTAATVAASNSPLTGT